MSKDRYYLQLTQNSSGHHVLWFVQNRFDNFVPIPEVFQAKHNWLDWVETFTFKGTVQRVMGGRDYRKIMVFSELSDAMIVKLAFDSSQFENLS